MFNIRTTKPEDYNFILSSWLQSYAKSLHHTPNSIVYDNHRPLIETCLKDPRVETLVATSDDSDQILGYLCHQGTRMHYIYVKHVFRRMGVAKAIVAAAKNPHTVTHWNTRLDHWNLDYTYDPYCFRSLYEQASQRAKGNEDGIESF